MRFIKIFFILFLIFLLFMFAACNSKTITETDDNTNDDDSDEIIKTYGNIYGLVIDKTTSQPIKNAEISVGYSKSTTTDSEGNFYIKDIETGSYSLSIYKDFLSLNNNSCGGEYLESYEINIQEGDNSLGQIKINPDILITEINFGRDNYDYVDITGKVKNLYGQKIDYLEIIVKLYNNDVRVAREFTNMLDVENKEEVAWEINTLYQGEYDDYKLEYEFNIN